MAKFLSPHEVRTINTDQSTLKACVNMFRVAAGDRAPSPRMRQPNRTDAANGYRQITQDERDTIQGAVNKLVAQL